jgi:hypothetical protein
MKVQELMQVKTSMYQAMRLLDKEMYLVTYQFILGVIVVLALSSLFIPSPESRALYGFGGSMLAPNAGKLLRCLLK